MPISCVFRRTLINALDAASKLSMTSVSGNRWHGEREDTEKEDNVLPLLPGGSEKRRLITQTGRVVEDGCHICRVSN